MEESPKIRKVKLSLLKRHRLNDSPKPSVKISDTSDRFGTPPPLKRNTDGVCTPPFPNTRKYFYEESPSQEYDSMGSYHLLPSQEVQSNIPDVGWKWDESPKEVKQEVVKLRQRSKTFASLPGRKNAKCNSLQEKIVSNECRGFYKFREELLKINSSEKWDIECGESELDSSLKENKDFIEIPKVMTNSTELEYITEQNVIPLDEEPKNRTKVSVKEKNTDSAPNNFKNVHADLFDDSDTDNLLVELSQQIEANIDQKDENIIIQNKVTQKLTIDDVEDDSFDDILLSLPLDDKEITKLPEVSETPRVQEVSAKSNLNRYNSMPVASISNTRNATNVTKPFTRHNSMPVNENKTSVKENCVAVTSSNSASTSSLNSNLSSRSNIPSRLADEIERRRQEAKQRLMKTMQRRLQQAQGINKLRPK